MVQETSETRDIEPTVNKGSIGSYIPIMIPPGPSLLGLPLELQEQILEDLAFPEIICLKITCAWFNSIIPPATCSEILQAETTEMAERKDVYTCHECVRLRPVSKFGDMMTKKKKKRGGINAAKRLCLDCVATPGIVRSIRKAPVRVPGVHPAAWV